MRVRRKKLTVFFSDIAGFTETADRMESEDLTRLLNHYLTEMSEIALSYGATIDKYVGDAIVIFFGDPETRGVKEDALACVEMAIAMRKRMRELQDVWRASGIEKPLQCRIGINTGYCTVGNFGSEDRMDYTIIGGGVNLASRLEAAATPGEILISYETYANVRHRIHCEERGQSRSKASPIPSTPIKSSTPMRTSARSACSSTRTVRTLNSTSISTRCPPMIGVTRQRCYARPWTGFPRSTVQPRQGQRDEAFAPNRPG